MTKERLRAVMLPTVICLRAGFLEEVRAGQPGMPVTG